MAVNLERKIQELENEIRALKSTYGVYGGAMKSYLSTSPTYTNEGGYIIWAHIKFTPDFKPTGNLLVSSVLYTLDDRNYASYALSLIQDGSGDVIIEVPVVGDRFSITLVSTSPGTFTRLQ